MLSSRTVTSINININQVGRLLLTLVKIQ
jgi:hypothetical protein